VQRTSEIKPRIYFLMLHLVNKCAAFRTQRLIFVGLGPSKSFGVIVPLTEPVNHCGFETTGAVEAAATNSLARN